MASMIWAQSTRSQISFAVASAACDIRWLPASISVMVGQSMLTKNVRYVSLECPLTSRYYMVTLQT